MKVTEFTDQQQQHSDYGAGSGLWQNLPSSLLSIARAMTELAEHLVNGDYERSTALFLRTTIHRLESSPSSFTALNETPRRQASRVVLLDMSTFKAHDGDVRWAQLQVEALHPLMRALSLRKRVQALRRCTLVGDVSSAEPVYG